MVADVQYQGPLVPFATTQSWASVFSWTNARVLTPGAEILVTNTDGTLTHIYGTGLDIDPVTGEPLAGTIDYITRTPPAGGTNEQIDFVSSAPLLAELRASGIGSVFFGGNDNFTGGGGNDNLVGGGGNDSFFDTAGNDTFTGGDGNDTYNLNYTSGSGTATIIEAGGSGSGYDIVYIGNDAFSAFTLGANLEELSHQGYSGIFKGTGNALNNFLRGGTAADTLIGLGGHDDLTGWEGSDTLIGGLGNDSYHIEDAQDKITENAGQGIDTVFIRSVFNSLKSYTLAANVENAEHESGYYFGAIKITGNTLSNSIKGAGFNGDELIGLAGNDTLDGAFGLDTLTGGLGNDTYIDPEGNDAIIELAGEGIDTVVTHSTNYILGNNIEKLVMLGGPSKGTGNALANMLVAEAGTVQLYGLEGDDTLVATHGVLLSELNGGKGNDTYEIDDPFDSITELDGEGSLDKVLVFSAASYSLSNFVEQGAIADGSKGQSRTLTGNTLANTLTGAASDDSLLGSAMFNDDGAIDTIKGGLGNDTYHIGAGDKITELANQGIDTVSIEVTSIGAFTLGANFENLDASGSGVAITVTGNTLANKITGSSLNDKLVGLAGNDVLWGQGDIDTLLGGLGNDTYILLDALDSMDVFTELANQGSDTILTDLGTLDLTSSAKYANIENVTGTGNTAHTFTGTDAKNVLTGDAATDTLQGGKGDDTLFGLGSVDQLFGGEGNDLLDGGTDADSMFGGKGNDTYIVDDSSETPFESADQGTDTVKTALAAYAMPGGGSFVLENLIYDNGAAPDVAFAGTGNNFDNVITGGTEGDTLNGDTGNDTLKGGRGNDTYVVDALGDKIVEIAGQGTDTIQTSLVVFTMGANAANVENLIYTQVTAFTGIGNALDNFIFGSISSGDKLFGLGGHDRLDGFVGQDEMTGGFGNDTYLVDNGLDKTIELAGQGTDTIETGLDTFSLADTGREHIENLVYKGSNQSTLTGNALNNLIIGGLMFDSISGGAGNDTLDGGADGDALTGGTGNDLYKIDNAGDTVFEIAGEGTADKAEVSLVGSLWTMGANLEIAVFKGAGSFLVKGNASNNTITGGAGADEIDGGAGNDLMTGLAGDDTYTVDAVGDKVTEAAKGGFDTVKTTLFIYTLGANVENLELKGAGNSKGTGNGLDNSLQGTTFDDVLTGLAGNDSLNGNGGKDTLIGGVGNDSYIVDSVDDIVTELAGQGTDEVRTTLSTYTLANEVERLAFTGAGSFNGTGNALANVITGGLDADDLKGVAGDDTLNGNGGNDTLTGGLGNDKLTGGTGDDDFVFTEGLGQGKDVIVDFKGAFFFGGDDIVIDSATINAYTGLIFGGSGQNVFQDADGARIQLDVSSSILILGYEASATQLTIDDFVFI